MRLPRLVKTIMAVGLLTGTYFEAGVWTAISLFLIFIVIEFG